MLANLWANFIQPILQFMIWPTGESNTGISPSMCFQNLGTIETLVKCFDTFTVPHAYYDALTYDLAQPIGSQREDWKALVRLLLAVDGNCSLTPIPASLQGFYAVEPFNDYCILYETTARCGTYRKGWGFMIVPAFQSGVSRNVHLSAPHPGYDLGTVEQAASIFKSTGSRSLLVPGRTRTAFLDPSDCIIPAPSQDYFKTDPAHNNQEPFFDASITIYNWQHQHGGCPSTSCAFIQFHGKGATTCSTDVIFLSSGIGNSSASKSWYTDNIDRPVKRLQRNLRLAFPSWQISLPSDSICPLTATKNVVGRHMNGITLTHVCSLSASSSAASGEFLHAEQATVARSPQSYDAWTQAILDSFDVTCAKGMILDRETKLCTMGPMIDGIDEETKTHLAQMNSRIDTNNPSRWYIFLSFLNII